MLVFVIILACSLAAISTAAIITAAQEQQVQTSIHNVSAMIQDKTGRSCGCQNWCQLNSNVQYGLCGDGHTCVCSSVPITYEMMAGWGYCGCNKWCQEDGFKDGGICGDGHTCICYGAQGPVGATWQEHWHEKNQLLTRVYKDDNVVLYFDKDVSRSAIPWLSEFIGNAWKYVKNNYGNFFGSDGRLYAVFHTGYQGGHAAFYYQGSQDYKNVIDQGAFTWDKQNSHLMSLLAHETFHIVEFTSFNTQGSPGYDTIWMNSKMAEIFEYDVYKGLNLNSYADEIKNFYMTNKDNFPKPNTYWFRDWLYPWYIKNDGKTKTLVRFF